MFAFIIGLLTGSYLTFLFYAKVSVVWKNVPDVASIMRRYRAEKQPHIIQLPDGKYVVRKKACYGKWEYRDNCKISDSGWWSEDQVTRFCLLDTLEEARKLRGLSGLSDKVKIIE